MTYKLSFCIPTYNRAEYLPELLDSIISQITDDLEGKIEICISDNASTDNTEEVVQTYKQKYDHITYHKNKENLGPDLNYLKSVEIASGEYCWFMGSDDALKQGALKRIDTELQKQLDIYLCNRDEFDKTLKNFLFKKFWLSPEITDRTYNLTNKEDYLSYLNDAIDLGALFSYLSSIVFKRENWNEVKYDNKFTGSAYSHVFVLLKSIQNHGALKYIQEALVKNRTDNDSFNLTNNTLKRTLIDFEGYLLLANTIFNDDKELRHAFLNVMTRNYSFDFFIHLQYQITQKEWNQFKTIVKEYPFKYIDLVNILRPTILPIAFVKRRINRLVRKKVS